MIYMTTAQTYTTPPCAGIAIQINQALSTTTLTVADSAGTKAVISGTAVQGMYRYYGPAGNGGFTVTPSGACDATISVLSRTMA